MSSNEIYDEDYTLWQPVDGTRKRIWRIVRQGDKHKTFAGIQPGGKIQESKWTYSVAKNVGSINATTPSEQAAFDIAVKIKRKLEAGLKSDMPLPVDTTSIKEWQTPTLAHKWKDSKDKLRYPVYVSPKLDGIRCVSNKDGMWSRNGKPFIACPHIWATIKHLFDHDPDLIIDGELYFHTDQEDNFDKICSIVKKSRPSPADLAEAKTMQYWVFDIKRNNSEPFSDRYKFYFSDLFHKDKIDHKIVRPVFQRIATTEAEVMDMSAKMIENGFEGSMIRNHDAPYVHKRTNDLLKYKEFQDIDVDVIDIEEGNGNRSGMMGRFKLRMPNGECFDASARGSHALFKRYLDEKDTIIGIHKATVRYQNLTPRGVPRFPVVVGVRDYE